MSAWPEEKESSTNSNNHLEFEDNFEVKLADKLDDSHEYLLKLGLFVYTMFLNFFCFACYFLSNH